MSVAGRRRSRAPRSRSSRPRLLTPLGRGLVVIGLLAALLGRFLHWQEFVQLAVLAAGLLAVGLLWQLLPGTPEARVVLRRPRVVAGSGGTTMSLEVQAGAAPLLFPRVVVPVGGPGGAGGGAEVALRLRSLAPFARHTEPAVPLPDLPRGVHAVGPVVVEKTDPVGVVARRSAVGAAVVLRVAPVVVDLPVFAGGLTHDLDGAASQQLSMSDLSFHALREYVPGDDLRHVHWRSSAKAGQLLVRQFHESRRGQVVVLLDGTRSAYPRPADFELAVSVAASVALRAVRDDFDTYLRCGEEVAHGREPYAMTDAACAFALAADDTVLAQAAAAASEVPATGLVVQVTGGGRDLAVLESAAARWGSEVTRLVVRADSGHEPGLHDSGTLRVMTVPDLPRLQDLMSRGMR